MKYILSTALILTIALCYGQAPITYHLSFENIEHHELKVKVTFTDLEGEVLEVKMPNSSPGRYAIHSFAKNVYEEKATDSKGNPIQITRKSPSSWTIPITDGTVLFEYTVFGNHADGTYLGVDSRKVHMNMPATFVYGQGLETRPIKLIIPSHLNWDVATQLSVINDSTFHAPDYYYFYDSPTVVGDMQWKRWSIDGQTIEIAIMHQGTEAEFDHYTESVKKIVNKQIEIYGELPKYDFGRYTFIIGYNPWVKRDAMEHRNSTVCTSQSSLATNEINLLRTVSHEFFHGWNIERIRPASLEPFNFDQANVSQALWFGEGFTNYFDRLVLARAKISTPQKFIQGQIANLNYVLFSPGREFRSPIAMSENAVFNDAGISNDQTNFPNTYVSYYSYGSVIALGLDMTLRLDYKTTLNELMKMVWEKYGKDETPYTIANLEEVLGKLTTTEFAKTFFRETIHNHTLPDFKPLFDKFGISLTLQTPQSPYFRNPKLGKNSEVTNTIYRGTALYEAGINQGDRLITIDNREIDSTGDLNRIINSLEVGKSYEVTFEQLGVKQTSQFTTVQDPRITLAYIPDEKLKSKNIKLRNSLFDIE